MVVAGGGWVGSVATGQEGVGLQAEGAGRGGAGVVGEPSAGDWVGDGLVAAMRDLRIRWRDGSV